MVISNMENGQEFGGKGYKLFGVRGKSHKHELVGIDPQTLRTCYVMRNQRYFVNLNKCLLWFIIFIFNRFSLYLGRLKKNRFYQLNQEEQKEVFYSYLSQSCNLESPKGEIKLMETELVSQISSFPTHILFQSIESLNFFFFLKFGNILYSLSSFLTVVPQRSELYLL